MSEMRTRATQDQQTSTDDEHGADRLSGKVAIITGGDSGIGRATAVRLAREGASMMIVYRPGQQDNAEITAALVGEEGRPCQLCPGDVNEPAFCDKVVTDTLENYGRLDILVNNAAVFSSLELRPFEQIPPEEFRRVMEVNVMGVWLCCRACVPHMRKGGYGRIVNLASGAPLKGVPLFLHYISSKGAVIAMTRGLAREVGADGITVNALAPGFTLSENVAKHAAHVRQGERTKMTRAIQRDEKPEDLVGAVSFLASEDAAFITGQTLVVDGGSAMV